MSLPPSATGQHAAINSFSRLQSRAAAAMLDLVIAACGVMAAYLLRFEGAIPESFYRQMLLLVPVVAVARVASNWLFGVYRIVWRYIGLHEAMRLVEAAVAVSAVLLIFRLFLLQHSPYFLVPISIIVIEGTLSFVGMTGTRFLPRIFKERGDTSSRQAGEPTLLVGAGQGGLAIAREAFRHASLNIWPVGFLDDNLYKRGKEIHGLRVLGTLQDLDRALDETLATQVIITTGAIPPKKILQITEQCRSFGVIVRIVPGLFEILGAEVAARKLREVRIEDLLSRDPVPPSLSLEDLTRLYGGKRILVTGAGGSIGSELCRQLILMQPSKLILVERDETNLFDIDRQLRSGRVDDICEPLLLDITNPKELERAFKEHRPEVVFHAAAFKHVPLMEKFAHKAVHNNVFGTKRLAELASEQGTESFVMISTDKAVNPTSVMGATKRLAEQIVQLIADTSETKFSCVRFGNVLGSRGSVVGIFREQIARGGPVTVTHPEARRYFMTIPEAANLVIQAGTIGDKGEVFLLDMGEPVRILDLARQMIQLSGFTESQVPIKLVGSRAGEKLFEELRTNDENIERTDLRKIFLCRPTSVSGEELDSTLERLQFAVKASDVKGIRGCLSELGIGYERDQSHRSAPDQSA